MTRIRIGESDPRSVWKGIAEWLSFRFRRLRRLRRSQSNKKGQFGVALEPEVVRICAYALLVGFIAGLVAQGLLELIHFFTNLFFYGKFSFAITNPANNHLGCG